MKFFQMLKLLTWGMFYHEKNHEQLITPNKGPTVNDA